MLKHDPSLNLFIEVPLEYKTNNPAICIICSQNKQQIAIFMFDIVKVYLLDNKKWFEIYQHKWKFDYYKQPICFNNNKLDQILFYDDQANCIKCLVFKTTKIFGLFVFTSIKVEQFIQIPQKLDILEHFNIKSLDDDDNTILIETKKCILLINVIQQAITNIVKINEYNLFGIHLYDKNHLNVLIDPFFINMEDQKKFNWRKNSERQNIVNCLIFQNIKNLKVEKRFLFNNKTQSYDFLLWRGLVLQTRNIEKLNDCGNIAVAQQQFQYSQSSEQIYDDILSGGQLTIFSLMNFKIIRKIQKKNQPYIQLKGRYYISNSYLIDIITLKQEKIVEKDGWDVSKVKNKILTLKNHQEYQHWLFK